MLLDAKLSITIISFGLILSTIPLITSTVSIPVVPRTPGAIALTGLASFSRNSGAYFIKCLVISISLATLGPQRIWCYIFISKSNY